MQPRNHSLIVVYMYTSKLRYQTDHNHYHTTLIQFVQRIIQSRGQEIHIQKVLVIFSSANSY